MSSEIPPTVTACAPAYCLERASVGHTAVVK